MRSLTLSKTLTKHNLVSKMELTSRTATEDSLKSLDCKSKETDTLEEEDITNLEG